MKPVVSVIITTKNEAGVVGSLLGSIARQTYLSREVILVDNHSTDNTRAIAESFGTRVFTKGPERSSQRNFGAQKATGDYVLFLDADMVLPATVIAECVGAVQQDPAIKAAVIPERSVGKGYWAKCKALERACYAGDAVIEAARFFEKEAFWEAGGYDERLTGPEDWDLPQKVKAKHKIGRTTSFIIHNERTVGLSSLAKKKFYYGLKVGRYVSAHPISVTSQQLIYLLRPAFYRNWKLLVSHPGITLGMVIMLLVEQFAGFAGFIKGNFLVKYRKL